MGEHVVRGLPGTLSARVQDRFPPAAGPIAPRNLASTAGAMTLQTQQPLEHRNLSATARQAAELVSNVTNGELDLNPPYQRGPVWTLDQRQNLIRSMLLGIPVPAVILNARWQSATWDQGPSWACVDGRQRIETMCQWMADELPIPASWIEPAMVDATFDTDDGPYLNYKHLTMAGRRITRGRFLIPVAEAQVDTVEEEAAIYLLVNGAGTAQSAGDLERAARIAAQH